MSILSIKTCPDPVLRKKAKELTEIDETVISLTHDMFETMYNAPGIGLAANQVGVSRQLIIIDIEHKKGDSGVILINPKIVHSKGESLEEEGCLSLPGIFGNVLRAEKIEAYGLDLDGKEIFIKAEGMLARAIQHEIDHINGSIFWDKIDKVQRDLLKRKYKKLQKE